MAAVFPSGRQGKHFFFRINTDWPNRQPARSFTRLHTRRENFRSRLQTISVLGTLSFSFIQVSRLEPALPPARSIHRHT